ncbi:MAG: thioredoxin family protein [Thermoguttaceae bacterium]|jgi:thiol:disulfide interchange protein|nr:thioredoxin family protein [Thermoguttaceae bacterium]
MRAVEIADNNESAGNPRMDMRQSPPDRLRHEAAWFRPLGVKGMMSVSMLRKIAFYGLSAAAIVAFACFVQMGEKIFPSASLSANVASESDFGRESVVFLDDFDAAKDQAAKENKPVMLFFMSQRCKHSVNMLNGAFSSPKVENLTKQFVCVQIEVNDPKNEELCDQFDVVSTPTVQFIAVNGDPLQRVTSEQSGAELAAQMQAALTSIAWRAARAESKVMLR